MNKPILVSIKETITDSTNLNLDNNVSFLWNMQFPLADASSHGDSNSEPEDTNNDLDIEDPKNSTCSTPFFVPASKVLVVENTNDITDEEEDEMDKELTDMTWSRALDIGRNIQCHPEILPFNDNVIANRTIPDTIWHMATGSWFGNE